jgi:hypothetical protein
MLRRSWGWGGLLQLAVQHLFESATALIDPLRRRFINSWAHALGFIGCNMLTTTEIAIFLGLGVLFAGGLIIVSRWAETRPALLAAYALIAASFLFVGFAIRAENAATWIGFEMTGVAIFGTLAGLTIVGSAWFVVAGLALHPVWALYIHYYGAGAVFAPAPFVWASVGFDIAAALYVLVSILSGADKKKHQTLSPQRRRKGEGA